MTKRIALISALFASQCLLAAQFGFDAEEDTSTPEKKPAAVSVPSAVKVTPTPAAPAEAPSSPSGKLGDKFKCGSASTNDRATAAQIVTEELGIPFPGGTKLEESENQVGNRATLTIRPTKNLVLRRETSLDDRDIAVQFCKKRDGLVRIYGTTTVWGNRESFDVTLRIPDKSDLTVVRIEGMGKKLREHTEPVHKYEDGTNKFQEWDNDYSIISK